MNLLPFQKRFIQRATAPGIDLACLSLPRGNGKSWLAAHLCSRALTPGDSLFVSGSEVVLFSGSIEQCRIVFRFVRQDLEPSGEYRFLDSATRCAITHRANGTRLRVAGSNSKTSWGLVGVPLCVLDEPGSLETVGGMLLYDSITTAQGKPGSPLRAVLIGTLAPALSGWWHDLVAGGSGGSVYIQALKGRRDRWDSWPEILRVNPLARISPKFRDKLASERAAARADSRLRARFLSYRLNHPARDESEVLLTTDDWEAVCGREVPPRQGRPIVGLDLAGGRGWSAAVALWRNGRAEALALCPGVPSIEDQERRDRAPAGAYRKLVQSGRLRVAEGLRVPPVSMLYGAVVGEWGVPASLVCDRFRLAELQDCIRGGCPVVPRVARWSEAAEDIRSLRQIAKDGPLSCEPESRLLLAHSLAVATVRGDDGGSVRMVKASSANTARDDVAAGLILSAGSFVRSQRRRPSWRYLGVA